MKRTFKLLLVGIVVGCVVGFISQPAQKLNEKVYFERVKPNQTLWSICESHYDDNNAETFNEFFYRVQQENRNAQNNVKMLKAGDKVVVRVFEKVK